MTKVMAQYSQCNVVAVEIDTESADYARPFCDRVIVADLETLDFAHTFGDERFDVIVAADVLEHLKDPWSCLKQAREIIAATGIYCSIDSKYQP